MDKKKDFGFVVEWGDKPKVKNWSGTPLSLLTALNKYYNIVEFDTTVIHGKIGELFRRAMYKTPTGILCYKDLLHHISKSKYNGLPVIQFGDYPIKNYINSYPYQDLCFAFLNDIMTNDKELYAVSGFQHMNPKTIQKRYKRQLKSYDNAAGIFTMGRWMEKYIRENYDIDPSKVHHVGGASNLDVNRINPDPNKDCRKILFVGRDFKRKAGYLVVDAFKILKEKYDPQAQLYIAGPQINPIDEKIEGYNFLGSLTYNQLSDYFNKCDIFVMPSHFEAYGLVFIEALIYGLPCIGRNAFEMPYFIEKGVTGDLIDDNDPEILAKKMFDLLHNEQIKQNVAERRQQLIKEYSWDSVAKRIYDVVENDRITCNN